MKKSMKKFKTEIISYGLYSNWEDMSRKIPDISKFSTHIPAIEGNEFGITLKIKGGKGAKITYRIKYPSPKDINKESDTYYTGDQIISSNDYTFYVGDCVKEPVAEKTGIWTITVLYKKRIIAAKEFHIVLPETP